MSRFADHGASSTASAAARVNVPAVEPGMGRFGLVNTVAWRVPSAVSVPRGQQADAAGPGQNLPAGYRGNIVVTSHG